MLRLSLLALLVSAASLWAVPAFAAPTPSPSPTHSAAPPAVGTAHPITIDGEVSGIDFKTGIMSVKSGAKHYDVIVLSSTQIQACKTASGTDCKPGFMSISDIVKDAKVHVTASQRGDEYRAQVITVVR
jgi:hypothetical protein